MYGVTISWTYDVLLAHGMPIPGVNWSFPGTWRHILVHVHGFPVLVCGVTLSWYMMFSKYMVFLSQDIVSLSCCKVVFSWYMSSISWYIWCHFSYVIMTNILINMLKAHCPHSLGDSGIYVIFAKISKGNSVMNEKQKDDSVDKASWKN